VTSRQQPSSDDSTGGGLVWTEERIRALGVITDLPTAGRIFGIGRAQAYDLARTGEFPAPVIAVGARFRVPVAGILTALGIPPDGHDLTTPATASVDHHDAIGCAATPGEPPSDQGET
jgi:hypothetical protein